MELIIIDKENVERYLDDCVRVQQHLLKPNDIVDPLRFKNVATDSHTCLFGVCVEGNLVGLGEVCKVIHPQHTVGYVHNIVIDPRFRGQGFFSILMEALEAKAKEWGCDQMNLTCSRSEVQPLYEKRGYKIKDTHFYTREL